MYYFKICKVLGVILIRKKLVLKKDIIDCENETILSWQ